jgi:hypothetical protein
VRIPYNKLVTRAIWQANAMEATVFKHNRPSSPQESVPLPYVLLEHPLRPLEQPAVAASDDSIHG